MRKWPRVKREVATWGSIAGIAPIVGTVAAQWFDFAGTTRERIYAGGLLAGCVGSVAASALA